MGLLKDNIFGFLLGVSIACILLNFALLDDALDRLNSLENSVKDSEKRIVHLERVVWIMLKNPPKELLEYCSEKH